MTESVKKQVPAYVSFTTARNFLDLIRTQGVPPVIDASILKHMSGSSSSQLRTALKYLGLTNDDGETNSTLENLAYASDEDRPSKMAKVLKSSYPFLFDGDFDLEKGTFRQFDDKFREQGASGATVVKAERFFLQAAKYAEIPISPYILKGMKTKRSSTKASKTKKPQIAKKPAVEQPQNAKGGERQSNNVSQSKARSYTQIVDADQYPILRAYFSQLPEDGTWESEDKRSQWLDGVKMALSFETSVDIEEDEYEYEDFGDDE